MTWYNTFLNDIREGDIPAFERKLQDLILTISSHYDYAKTPENFFHRFIMGVTASLKDEYHLCSNRESDLERYDFAMIPFQPNRAALLFEFKSVKEEEKLQKTAQEALQQIESKKYDTDIKKHQTKRVIKIGITFSGKVLAMAYEEEYPPYPATAIPCLRSCGWRWIQDLHECPNRAEMVIECSPIENVVGSVQRRIPL